MLAGCAAPLQPGAPVPVPAQAPTATAPPAPAPAPPPPSPPPQPPAPALPAPAPAPALPEATGAAARRLLTYHEHLRRLAPAELGAELARQNAALTNATPGDAAAVTLELALVLGQIRNPADTVRALALLEPLARSTLPEQQPWQALARLLAARLAEQRRLEEQLDRQAAQLRDSQRNAQQLKEKLEALKAIERSIDNRVPAPAPPASGAPRP